MVKKRYVTVAWLAQDLAEIVLVSHRKTLDTLRDEFSFIPDEMQEREILLFRMFGWSTAILGGITPKTKTEELLYQFNECVSALYCKNLRCQEELVNLTKFRYPEYYEATTRRITSPGSVTVKILQNLNEADLAVLHFLDMLISKESIRTKEYLSNLTSKFQLS